ncbi:helix-turn-helix transcriptional regulator [Comamonas sp. Tr-654]|uniref:S24 family peptidase n=1 Tax=Comamonas sp. Tr-654 TaxID=2608341 RepID=UPI00142453EC|nr:helix-turn-helix transcriptional regulator [Comamonas sp. Tr-654]NIF85269.1 helix-turn-helix transcriptional regulator [Comamonas sp. Tr-654]
MMIWTPEEEAHRLAARFRDVKQAAFAREFNVPGGASMISQHIKGHRPISLEAALAYAKGFECTLADISPRLAASISAATKLSSKDGTQQKSVVNPATEAPADGYVRLQHLSPRPTMGSGALLDEPIHVVRHLDVLERWLMEEVGSCNYSKVKVLTAVGRSMMPTINDKDLVFVDISHRAVDAPGIYVVDVAGRLLLKKAMIKANGTLVLRSDNASEYPDEETYNLASYVDEITVCGKVLAWWTLRKG